jgi:hypothetical protein
MTGDRVIGWRYHGRRSLVVILLGLACVGQGRAGAAPAGGASKDFTLTFRSESDPLVGGSSTFLYASALHVDGASGRAELRINHHQANLPHPIGLFADTVGAGRLDALAAALAAVDWAALPAGQGGDVSAATLTLEYTRGSNRVRRVFNARNANVLAALGPVMAQLDELDAQLLKKPRRALALAVARSRSGFKISWRNVGTGPITITDPRAAGTGAGAATRGFVKLWRLPPARPGWDPPIPTPITVPLVAATGADKPVTIAPGQTFEAVTQPVTAPAAPGEEIVQASWIDYDGPAPASSSSSSSLAEQVDDKRPYVIRGAAFSGNVKVKAD